MRPSYLTGNIELHPEFQSELQADLQAEPYAEIAEHRADFSQNGPLHYEFRDRVVINGDDDRNHVSPHEPDDKWEPVPQHLLYQDAALQYTADPLDFCTPAEAADLPDLDFPVPDQNVIPEMIFENDEPSQPPAPPALPPHVPSHVPSPVPPSARHSIAQARQTQSRRSRQAQAARELANAQLIPIQSSVVAHARSGKMSMAAIQERRIKNTEAARRSRARRADKITELRNQNDELMTQNAKLMLENRRLTNVVKSLEEQLRTGVEHLAIKEDH